MEGMTSYAYTPELREMLYEAAKIPPPPCRVSIVVRTLKGRALCLTGRSVKRNGLDGMQETVLFRWKMDGKSSTKRAVLEAVGDRLA
jgi:hypothetical protein